MAVVSGFHCGQGIVTLSTRAVSMDPATPFLNTELRWWLKGKPIRSAPDCQFFFFEIRYFRGGGGGGVVL